MIADIPYLPCLVRLPFISRACGLENAYAFGIRSYPGRCLGFEVMLKSGAHYRNVPIHAICTRPDADPRPLGDCQMWDCFTARPLVHVYRYLEEHEAVCLLRSGQQGGKYLFTVEWAPDDRGPGFTHIPDQNKCGHVLELDDGNLACLPTNCVAWRDAYFIGPNPEPWKKCYRVQEEVWQAEDSANDVSGRTALFYTADRQETASEPPEGERPS